MTLKARLAAGETLVGTFIKTPSPMIVEVLSLSPLDCLCLDAEHAPFDRIAIDSCVLAARAGGMPVLVRVPKASPEHILNALDCGASGVVLPHIASQAQARAAVQASFHGAGGRGYAGSTRAAGYTTLGMAGALAAGREAVVIAQIEDVEALDQLDAILAVEGIDAFFIGRADLTVALGADSADAPAVIAAVEAICAAGQRHGRRIGMFLARTGDIPHWQTRGASLFLLESDHNFLLAGAKTLAAQVR